MSEKCPLCEIRDDEHRKLIIAKRSADALVEELEKTVLGLKTRLRTMQLDLRKLADGPLVDAADRLDAAAGPLLAQIMGKLRDLESRAIEIGPEEAATEVLKALRQLCGYDPTLEYFTGPAGTRSARRPTT